MIGGVDAGEGAFLARGLCYADNLIPLAGTKSPGNCSNFCKYDAIARRKLGNFPRMFSNTPFPVTNMSAQCPTFEPLMVHCVLSQRGLNEDR
jgi:hypothetical protein